VRPQRAQPPVRRGTVFWVERRDRAILVRKRPEKGLLGGMLEVPSTDWTAAAPNDIPAAAPVQADWSALPAQVEHTFTHFHLVLDIWRAETVGKEPVLPVGDYRWVAPGDLHREALPSLMRKVVAAVLGPEALRPDRASSRVRNT
jgi:A/G-specific adenine glycosylase